MLKISTSAAASNRTLFVNANRYWDPPVIPLAVEYLVNSLRSHFIEVEVLDLCFSSSPLTDLDRAIEEMAPTAICMTIRNLDSVLYPNTEYFLPEIKKYIQQIRTLSRSPIIIGGCALTADPSGILDFLGADIAICGPGEVTLPNVIKDDQMLRQRGRVIQGKVPDGYRTKRAAIVSYETYLEKGGIPGFETHKGCSSQCVYCMEAGTPVRFRKPDDVVCELRHLVNQGFYHLHLCDSEFNEDLDYCIRLLKAIIQEKLKLQWALYMKPGNYHGKLFELLRDSGAYLVTLSVDTFQKNDGYWKEITDMVSLCKKNGIRVSVDLLTGFPYEDETQVRQSLDCLRKIAPDEVVVNVFLRLYKNLAITKIIENDPSLKKSLVFHEKDQKSLLSPAFYHHLSLEKLQEFIHNDSLFRVAGAEKVVNYQKA